MGGSRGREHRCDRYDLAHIGHGGAGRIERRAHRGYWRLVSPEVEKASREGRGL
jgi:hypothetical protein